MTNADSLVREIFSSNTVVDASGNTLKLRSSISRQEGGYLRSLIQEYKIERSIEIGCAHGISSLYISDGLSQRDSPVHVIIDPFQSSIGWNGVGVNNLERAGLSFYELIEMPSEIILPSLVEDGRTFEFAFVDGSHEFANVFIDFFYLNQLLEMQGIIVFHDANQFSVKKALQLFVSCCPNYRIIGSVAAREYRLPKRLLNASKPLIGNLVRLFPKVITRELFNDSLLSPKTQWDENVTMIVFQKTPSTEI